MTHFRILRAPSNIFPSPRGPLLVSVERRDVSSEDNSCWQTSVQEKGLEYSIPFGAPGEEKTGWLEAGPENSHEWPGLGKYREYPEAKPASSWRDHTAREAAKEEWLRASEAYDQKRNADPAYRAAQSELMELQLHEPQLLPAFFGFGNSRLWLCRGNVIRLESKEPESVRDKSTDILSIKHFILRREKQYERVRREVEALENIEKLAGAIREPIPDSVRLFVWQRDRGKCVKCGSQQRLEFDHIIPVAEAGSSTERNVQLLCETCNRSKGATI
jgi:5-methylcytosine-specific restriction endonuclease McrA